MDKEWFPCLGSVVGVDNLTIAKGHQYIPVPILVHMYVTELLGNVRQPFFRSPNHQQQRKHSLFVLIARMELYVLWSFYDVSERVTFDTSSSVHC